MSAVLITCQHCGASSTLTDELQRVVKRAICVSCNQEIHWRKPMLSEKLNKSLSHRVPTSETGQICRIESLREAAKIFGEAIETHSKPSREQSLAITNLEQSLMWAIKGVVLE